MPVLPSWLTDPLWDQFAALLPERSTADPAHPLGCHRRRISDRICAAWCVCLTMRNIEEGGCSGAGAGRVRARATGGPECHTGRHRTKLEDGSRLRSCGPKRRIRPTQDTGGPAAAWTRRGPPLRPPQYPVRNRHLAHACVDTPRTRAMRAGSGRRKACLVGVPVGDGGTSGPSEHFTEAGSQLVGARLR